MPGIMTSRRIKSGGASATMASASLPLAAVRRTNPSGLNMISSNSLFWGLSSTIRTRAGFSAMSGVEFIFTSPSGYSGNLHQVRRDRRQELPVRQRLGDITITPGRGDALLVAFHRQGSESNYRNGAGRMVGLELRGGLEAVHAGQLDVHQDQVGLHVASQRQPVLGVRGTHHGVARRFQQKFYQLHVGGVVFDDQNSCHVRRPLVVPTLPAGLLP